jgi:peptidoglycan glycosyltransferase
VRVDTWLNPWSDPQNHGFQIIQSWYAFGSGGVAGTGLGLGSPKLIPNAATDFVFSAIGEELGLVGTIGVLAAFMLLMGSAYRIAVDATRSFEQLFAAGIATILGLQAFLIIGGVTRVIPLTGITLPFVSYGGSSLVANFALLAILLRISDDSARERAGPGAPR